jgi:hypothetical protein
LRAGVAAQPFEDFPAVLTRALELGRDATISFYLDPYGIKESLTAQPQGTPRTRVV